MQRLETNLLINFSADFGLDGFVERVPHEANMGHRCTTPQKR